MTLFAKRRAAAYGSALLLVLVGTTLMLRVCRPRIVVEATLPDGTRICVAQRFTWTAELFETSVYSKRQGRPWGWFYYDHQDLPWLFGALTVDRTNTSAVILRGSKAVGRYCWNDDTFVHIQRGTVTGPRPSTWTPPGGHRAPEAP